MQIEACDYLNLALTCDRINALRTNTHHSIPSSWINIMQIAIAKHTLHFIYNIITHPAWEAHFSHLLSHTRIINQNTGLQIRFFKASRTQTQFACETDPSHCWFYPFFFTTRAPLINEHTVRLILQVCIFMSGSRRCINTPLCARSKLITLGYVPIIFVLAGCCCSIERQ